VWVVDAFATSPFSGNPAGVVYLREGPVSDAWMGNVAAEMNHPETAFVSDGGGEDSDERWHFGLRWFTPTTEVDLCGHATLAAARAMWGYFAGSPDEFMFHTKSGPLICRRGRGSEISMEFPSLEVEACEAPAGLMEGLPGVRARFVGRGKFDYLVVAEDVGGAEMVRGLVPDLGRIARVAARGVIVAARGEKPGVDVVSRFFAPQSGVDEDPVTGSAHCVLGPWFGRELKKDVLECEQASPRGGRLRVRVRGETCELVGNAVTVLEGLIVAESA
jgi:predicted PhzF superfamily epimerase YddE/YHI9